MPSSSPIKSLFFTDKCCQKLLQLQGQKGLREETWMCCGFARLSQRPTDKRSVVCHGYDLLLCPHHKATKVAWNTGIS